MNVIVVGCGRLGVELALAIHRDHPVTVIDAHPDAFDRLGPHFAGRTIQGEALERAVLERAGIESADALAAVTASDNVNAVVAQIARRMFNVKRVVARVYNPRRIPIYENLNIQTVASSSWGAQRIEQLLLHPGLQSLTSTSDGEVRIYEMIVPPAWNGRKLAELVPHGEAVAAALERRGRGMLPGANVVLETDDVLLVSTTSEGALRLRKRVHKDGVIDEEE